MKITKCTIHTPLGEMIAIAQRDALTGLRFGQKYEPPEDEGCATDPDTHLFSALRRQLDAYFAGKLRAFDVPLSLGGTPFQRAVWELLKTIPYGRTTTYGALAKQLAREGGPASSARAIGGAVGHNPVSLIVPCHRVIGSDGSLTGYAGGLDRKAALLLLEKRDPKTS